MAPQEGVEPPSARSELAVLPLNDWGMNLVGPEGLEPSLGSLRGSCAAANTSGPDWWSRWESHPDSLPSQGSAFAFKLRDQSWWARWELNPQFCPLKRR